MAVASSALIRRSFLTSSAAATAFGLMLFAPLSYAQTAAAPDARAPVVNSAPQIDADTTSCQELKSKLESSGTLTIVSRQGGGSDTYYARTPQCQFWQMPSFSYVMASDGRCGVGSICTNKAQGK